MLKKCLLLAVVALGSLLGGCRSPSDGQVFFVFYGRISNIGGVDVADVSMVSVPRQGIRCVSHRNSFPLREVGSGTDPMGECGFRLPFKKWVLKGDHPVTQVREGHPLGAPQPVSEIVAPSIR